MTIYGATKRTLLLTIISLICFNLPVGRNVKAESIEDTEVFSFMRFKIGGSYNDNLKVIDSLRDEGMIDTIETGVQISGALPYSRILQIYTVNEFPTNDFALSPNSITLHFDNDTLMGLSLNYTKYDSEYYQIIAESLITDLTRITSSEPKIRTEQKNNKKKIILEFYGLKNNNKINGTVTFYVQPEIFSPNLLIYNETLRKSFLSKPIPNMTR